MDVTVRTLVQLADALELDAGDLLNGAIGKQKNAAPLAREKLRREAVGRGRVRGLNTRWFAGTRVSRRPVHRLAKLPHSVHASTQHPSDSSRPSG